MVRNSSFVGGFPNFLDFSCLLFIDKLTPSDTQTQTDETSDEMSQVPNLVVILLLS
jgi:hypothetical protein